jgi:hypothetical protein
MKGARMSKIYFIHEWGHIRKKEPKNKQRGHAPLLILRLQFLFYQT